MRMSIIAIYVALLPALALADGPSQPQHNDPEPAAIRRDIQADAVKVKLEAERQREFADAMAKSAESQAKARSAIATADKIYLNFGNEPFQNVPPRYRGVAGWWNAVDQYSRLTTDATNMAVASVLQASDLLKPRGAQAQIDYFEALLPQTKNETVRRAIRLQLIDAYKQANNPEKALDELQTLITAAPKGK
jgi:hypothetical protein